MFIELCLVLATSVARCGGEEPEPEKTAIPEGPNLVTPSPTTTEPYEIVLVKAVSYSADGSLAHYTLLHQNRQQGGKKGWTWIGHLVDVSTGKELASYQVEQKGFMCPSLKPAWERAKPKAWGDAFLKQHGFAEVKPSLKPPAGRASLKMQGKKTNVGWLATWPTRKWYAWVFKEWKLHNPDPAKFDPRMELHASLPGQPRRLLHTHVPYINYHFALASRAIWDAGREREKRESRECLEEFEGKQCRRYLRTLGLMPRNEYAFTGEVTIYWHPKGDAFLAFWDDRQVRDVGQKSYHVVFRSYVTVHSLSPRAVSTLIAKEAPPPRPAASAMAVAAKGTDSAGTGRASSAAAGMSGKATPRGSSAQPASAMKEAGKKGGERAPSTNKAGCGCQSWPAGSPLGVLALLALALGLLVARRRR